MVVIKAGPGVRVEPGMEAKVVVSHGRENQEPRIQLTLRSEGSQLGYVAMCVCAFCRIFLHQPRMVLGLVLLHAQPNLVSV